MAALRLNRYNGLKISDIKVESNATQAIPAATIDPAAVDLNDETVCSLNSDLGTHTAKIKANGEELMPLLSGLSLSAKNLLCEHQAKEVFQ
ncbi:hypothetical protein PGH46_06155 [Legionella pneumophila]|nr:hypothetical protein PGH46_06155 [Legionella pneumophila]